MENKRLSPKGIKKRTRESWMFLITVEMRIQPRCDSEQGPDLRGVAHVVRDVGITAVKMARTCGVGQGR